MCFRSSCAVTKPPYIFHPSSHAHAHECEPASGCIRPNSGTKRRGSQSEKEASQRSPGRCFSLERLRQTNLTPMFCHSGVSQMMCPSSSRANSDSGRLQTATNWFKLIGPLQRLKLPKPLPLLMWWLIPMCSAPEGHETLLL